MSHTQSDSVYHDDFGMEHGCDAGMSIVVVHDASG